MGSLAEKLRAAAAAMPAVWPEGLHFREVLAKILRGCSVGSAGDEPSDFIHLTTAQRPILASPRRNGDPAAFGSTGGAA